MRRSAMVVVAVLFLAGFLAPGAACPDRAAAGPGTGTAIVSSSLSERFGVASSHIKLFGAADIEAELDAMADAGITWLRCDFAWSDLEPSEGSWNFAGADRVVAEALERGINVLGILGTSPAWANGGHEWNWPPTDIDAWKDYVSVVCSRYAGRVSAWEVWNEQNIDLFWQPAPDADAYVALLAAASPEIRAADPGARIVMGGVAGLGPSDLDAYLSRGAADYIDALAYHPYATTIGVEGQPEEDLLRPKEGLCRDLVDFVHWLVAQHTSKDLEIWITEVGWTTCAQSPPGVDEDTQGAYMLRTMINYAVTDVDRVIWYNLRDSWENEWDRYGLLGLDFSPKPAYGCYATFNEVFGPASGVEENAATFSCLRMDTLEAHAFRLPSGGLALAAWKADDADDTLTVNVPDPSLADPVAVDPATGAEAPVPGVSRDGTGNITVSGLAIGETPLILRLDLEEPQPGENAFYFAEGFTGEGFQEYLCVGNADAEAAEVDVEFLFNGMPAKSMHVSIPPGYRTTIDVNGVVGAGKDVAMVVTSPQDIVAERPMYFSYGAGWTGGHVVVGAPGPALSHYFAEGCTGEGFDEWLCVLNPGDEPAGLTFRFQTEEEGEKVVGGRVVPPHSRASFSANELLDGAYQASCRVDSSRPVVVERPMYFDYRGFADNHWQGGHCVVGATATATTFFFAEGTTRDGFDEWLTLQNCGAGPIEIEAEYCFGPGQGEPSRKSYRVERGKRLTVFVPGEVGEGKDVSIRLSSSSAFLAERPMYFDYAGAGADHWQGGHCVIGATSVSAEMFFAEGYTGEGFHEWLCLQNPAASDAVVEVTYLTQEEGALPPRRVAVPSRTRVTLFVGDHAGEGYQLSCRLRVLSGPPVIGERPMYFSQGGRDGGHDVIGYSP
ncbi:MAG: beta-galactosidase [Actinomycetota bacterium]